MRRWLSGLLMLAAITILMPQRAGAVPPPGPVLQLAGTADRLFAGTWCGVYTLGRDERQWTEVAGLREIPSRRLVRLTGDVLLAGTAGFSPGGIYRHAPGGWTRVLDAGDALLAANPAGTHAYALLYADQGSLAVLRSVDGCRSLC